MSLSPIAPLTRREARAAKQFRADMGELVAALGPTEASYGAVTLIQRAVRQLDDAIAEYDRRAWWRLTPDAGHRIRLRPWMLEMRALAVRERDRL